MSNIFFKDYISKLTSVLGANDWSIFSSLANDVGYDSVFSADSWAYAYEMAS